MIPSSLDYADESRVAGAQARALDVLQAQGAATAASLKSSLERAEKLARSFDIELPLVATTAASGWPNTARLHDFSELLAAAPVDAGLHDALGAEDRVAALRRLHAVGRRPEGTIKIDRSDWIIAGIAGLLAGAADVALVGRSAASSAELALLPRGVRAGFARLLTKEAVGKLERAYKVPFDASTNRRLSRQIKGLFPKSHAFTRSGTTRSADGSSA